MYVLEENEKLFFSTNISMFLRNPLQGSNILQKDILRAIIKSKVNKIKVHQKKLKTHCIYCQLGYKLLIKLR